MGPSLRWDDGCQSHCQLYRRPSASWDPCSINEDGLVSGDYSSLTHTCVRPSSDTPMKPRTFSFFPPSDVHILHL